MNNEINGLVDIEKVVEKWRGFLRHGDMGMVAEDDKWREGYGHVHEASCTLENRQQRGSEGNGWGIWGMKGLMGMFSMRLRVGNERWV